VNRWPALDAAKDYRIKVTLGITGWYCLSVQSDGNVRHLDVGSSYPGGGEAPKGMAVRHLKRYVSWVQTVQQLNASWEIERFESRGIENDIQKNHGGSL
jgi:hypothetical protein